MAKISKQAKRVLKARTLLMVFFPFYGTLVANLELIEAKAVGPQKIETMATDGKRVYFNPDFVDELYDDELMGVLAHEAGHCANLHHLRRGDRDPLGWNIAGDYVLNIDLTDAGLKLPKGGLLDAKYRGWSTEAVFADLFPSQPQQPPSQPQQGKGKGKDAQKPSSAPQGKGQQGQDAQKPGKAGQSGKDGQPQSGTQAGQTPASGSPKPSQDPGRCGQVLDAPASDGVSKASDADRAEQEADWQRITRQAISVATRAAGKRPGYVERLLGELNKPREDWRTVLRQFVDQTARDDYSYARPDRRFAGAPFILPSLHSEGIEHLVDVIDASGSIDDGALKRFVSESQSMLDQGLVNKLTILVHDDGIRAVYEYTPGDQIDLKVVGGGGTKFRPVWEWVAKQSDPISGVVWFTDLESSDGFGNAPHCPVLWAVYGSSRSKPTFGDIVAVGE